MGVQMLNRLPVCVGGVLTPCVKWWVMQEDGGVRGASDCLFLGVADDAGLLWMDEGCLRACSREDPGHGHWSEGSSLGGLGIMVTALAPSGKVCNLRVVLCAMAGHLQGSYPGPWQHAGVQKTCSHSPPTPQLLVLQYTSPRK